MGLRLLAPPALHLEAMMSQQRQNWQWAAQLALVEALQREEHLR
jgi:hypothetical protein